MVELVDEAIVHSGADVRALSGPGGTQAHANLEKLVDVVRSAMDRGLHTLHDLLAWFTMQREVGHQESEAHIADETTGAVRIMTVHAAKGLEAPWVFVADISNRGINRRPPVLTTPQGTVWYEYIDADGNRQKPDELVALQDHDRAEDDDESRRLMYVAMTRAERGLVLSGTFGMTSTGRPRVDGSLAWLADDLDLDLTVPPGTTHHAAGTIDCTIIEPDASHSRPARQGLEAETVRIPDALVRVERPGPSSETPVVWPPPPVIDSRHAARRGTEMHAAIEAVIDHGGLHQAPDGPLDALDGDDRRAVERLASASWFTAMLEQGLRSEVPFTARVGDRIIDGRFDALLIDGDHWHVLDFKSALPDTVDEAMSQHRDQADRYIAAALAAQAATVTMEFVDMRDPGHRAAQSVTAGDGHAAQCIDRVAGSGDSD